MVDLKHLKGLIDQDGVLRIPETIRIFDFGGPSLNYQLDSVGHNTFDYLTELKELRIPATCTKLEWCFYHCPNLAAIQVEEDNPTYCSVDGVLFSKDKKELIVYPNAHGKDYTVPMGVKSIGKFVFKSCRDIETVRLAGSVREIEVNALYGCNHLKTVYLPDGFKKFHKHTENANVRCIFVYRGKSYSYEEILEMFK